MIKHLVCVIFLAASCATTPVTERRQVVLVSSQEMLQLGEKAFEEIKAKTPSSTDPTVNEAVTTVADRIARASQEKLPWQFAVFESKDVNAFCLPGGKIGVFTGILPVAKDQAGLAAVLGHEVAHAAAQHAAERVSQAMLIAGVLKGAEQAMGDQKYKPLIMAALGLGSQFGILLPFNRHQENEADEIGLIYMARAGYNPEAAIDLWERMAKLQGGQPPEFLSTHPNPAQRIKHLKEILPKAMAIYNQSQKVADLSLPLPKGGASAH